MKKSSISDSMLMSERTEFIVQWLLLLCWLAGVIYVSCYHEVWKDEVRALTIARAAEHIWQLPHLLKNEGHPILWYIILWLGSIVTDSVLVLQIASISVACGGIVVFLFYSPFRIWFKALFLFSFLPFYEYSVMARNYGISMLLFFSFAALYPHKNKRPFLLALVLFLLANTNIHSTIFVCFFVVFWAYEVFFFDKGGHFNNSQFITILFIVFSGVIFAVVTVIPDDNSIVLQTSTISMSSVLSAISQTIVHPGYHFREILPGLPLVGRDILIWAFIGGLMVKPIASLVLLGGTLVLGVLFSIGYSGVLRHQGIFFLYVITLYWMLLSSTYHQKYSQVFFTPLFKAVLHGVLPIVLLVHMFGSYKYITRDVTKQMSSSKALGKFLLDNEQFHEAILMGEPDIRLEALSYYAGNRVFVPRANRFENYIKLTKENKKTLSLGELHAIGRSIQIKEKVPVLIALGHFDLLSQKTPPFVRYEQYGREFTWTTQGLEWFHADTEKIAEFKEDVKNERYEIFLLK